MQWSGVVDGNSPIDFYLQGTRGAYAACAAAVDAWQSISVACRGCGARYIATVSRRDSSHTEATVLAYPDVAGQRLLAERTLERECPDHGFRLRVRAFSVVG
jgi:hypothetical protein